MNILRVYQRRPFGNVRVMDEEDRDLFTLITTLASLFQATFSQFKTEEEEMKGYMAFNIPMQKFNAIQFNQVLRQYLGDKGCESKFAFTDTIACISMTWRLF